LIGWDCVPPGDGWGWVYLLGPWETCLLGQDRGVGVGQVALCGLDLWGELNVSRSLGKTGYSSGDGVGEGAGELLGVDDMAVLVGNGDGGVHGAYVSVHHLDLLGLGLGLERLLGESAEVAEGGEGGLGDRSRTTRSSDGDWGRGWGGGRGGVSGLVTGQEGSNLAVHVEGGRKLLGSCSHEALGGLSGGGESVGGLGGLGGVGDWVRGGISKGLQLGEFGEELLRLLDDILIPGEVSLVQSPEVSLFPELRGLGEGGSQQAGDDQALHGC